MNIPLALLCAAAAGSLALTAAAQTPAPKPAAKPNSAVAPGKKPPPKAAPKPAGPALPVADAEQLKAAGMTYVGGYDCEFNQTVMVEATPRQEGYVDVKHLKNTWTMKPVLSSTGALRLEDVKGRMLMLQVANKSMVMDVKLGQRVLNDCLHATQKAFVKPADAQGLGIEPAPAAASASKR